jgi:DNA-binding beta-propeller fold protein YncE
MKAITIFVAVLIQSVLINAQTTVDYFGMPYEGTVLPYNNTRFTGDNVPVTEILPALSFPSPTAMASGIAWDGTWLWVCGYLENRIFCVDPSDGTVIKTIQTNIARPYGIACYNSVFYILDTDNKLIVNMDENGNVIETFALCDYGTIIFPTGLYVSDDVMIFNDAKGASPLNAGDSTYFLRQSVLSGYGAYADFPSGIAYDGEYLYVTDNPSQSTAKIDMNGFVIVERFTAPGGAYPNGLAWGNGGLWYVNNASDSVYFVQHLSTQNSITEGKKEFYIYPNPASNQLYFSADYPDRVIITDASGRQVAARNGEEVISIEGLKKGMYFICSETKTEKLIISR